MKTKEHKTRSLYFDRSRSPSRVLLSHYWVVKFTAIKCLAYYSYFHTKTKMKEFEWWKWRWRRQRRQSLLVSGYSWWIVSLLFILFVVRMINSFVYFSVVHIPIPEVLLTDHGSAAIMHRTHTLINEHQILFTKVHLFIRRINESDQKWLLFFYCAHPIAFWVNKTKPRRRTPHTHCTLPTGESKLIFFIACSTIILIVFGAVKLNFIYYDYDYCYDHYYVYHYYLRYLHSRRRPSFI